MNKIVGNRCPRDLMECFILWSLPVYVLRFGNEHLSVCVCDGREVLNAATNVVKADVNSLIKNSAPNTMIGRVLINHIHKPLAQTNAHSKVDYITFASNINCAGPTAYYKLSFV